MGNREEKELEPLGNHPVFGSHLSWMDASPNGIMLLLLRWLLLSLLLLRLLPLLLLCTDNLVEFSTNEFG